MKTACALVTSLSPFAVFAETNRAPVANAGVDQAVEATSPAGAVVTLNGSASSDPDGDPLLFTWSGALFGSRSGAIVAVQLSLGKHTVVLTVDDGRGGSSSDSADINVVDTVPPAIVITVPANAVYTFNQVVAASYSCADGGSGIATCAGSVPPGGAIDTATEGTHVFTVTARDAAGNASTSTRSYSVTGLEGRMTGEGSIDTADGHGHRFDFEIAERRIGLERGHLEYVVKTPKSGKQKERADRFESTSVGPIAFWDNPAFKPGKGPKPTTDSVVFSGTGRWNNVAGYTSEVTAADEGEPGRGRDRFAITIRDGLGSIVATVSGALSDGNIQSERIIVR